MLPGYVPYIAARVPVCKTFSGFLKKMFLKVFKHLLAYEKKKFLGRGKRARLKPPPGSGIPRSRFGKQLISLVKKKFL
jgi:hypothetical protein